MTIRDDLIAARALIDTPEKWRKDSDPTKESCCAIIAINRVIRASGRSPSVYRRAHWLLLHAALPSAWQSSRDEEGEAVGVYNDAPQTTHADILALYDRAIEAAT